MEEGARKRKIKFTKLSLTKSSGSSSENLGKTASTQISQFFRKHKSENGVIDEEESIAVEINSPEQEIIEPKIRRSSRTVKKLPERNPNKEITKFLSNNDDEESDFLPKKKKMFTPVKEDKSPVVRKSRAKRQPDIRKALKRYSRNDELDPEHLQMALALSRSLIEIKEGVETSQEQLAGINTKRTLAEFGFKSKSSLNKDYSSLMGFDGKVPKWMKKCTRLTRRNPEAQKKLMEEKVQILMDEEFLEHPYYEKTDRNYRVTSDLLKNCYSKENKTFFKSSLEQESAIIFDCYYVRNLRDLVQKSTSAVGCLLKDWSKIPGRDLSPEHLDIDMAYFPTQKLYTQKEPELMEEEPKISENNEEKEMEEEEEETYLFSEESETEIEEVRDKDNEHILSAKSQCSQNNAKNIEIEKHFLIPELLAISSEENVVVGVENNSEVAIEPVTAIVSLDKMEAAKDPTINVTSLENECEEQIDIEILSSNELQSPRTVQMDENSPERMDVELEPENEKSVRVPSPDMFSDLESSSSESVALNENVADQRSRCHEMNLFCDLDSSSSESNALTIIYPFESYISKNLPSFSQVASIVVDDSSADESITEYNGIIHYEKYNSEEAKIGNNKSIIVLSDDEEEEIEETPEKEIVSLSPTDTISFKPVASDYTKNDGLSKIFEESFSLSDGEIDQIDLTQDDGIISPQSKIDEMISKIDSILSNRSDDLILSDEEINFSIRKADKMNESLIQVEFDDFDLLIHGREDNILEESIVGNLKERDLLDESLTEILNKTDFDEISPTRPKQLKRFRSENIIQTNRPDDFCYPDLLSDDEAVVSPEDDLEISPNKVIEFLSKTFETEFEFETDLYTIKTKNVQSKPDYKSMSLSGLTEELKKFGLKKLSRQRAIFILEHIYKQTHPVFNEINGNLFIEEEIVTKKKSPKRKQVEKKKFSSSQPSCSKNLEEINELSQDSEITPEEDFSADLLADDGTSAEIEYEEYYLPSKPRGKINSCAVPLHIAFYNKTKSDKKLRELILCYEPINLDELYAFFKGIGLRYEPNDLISFLDSRCITFRTFKNQKNDRNNRKNCKE